MALKNFTPSREGFQRIAASRELRAALKQVGQRGKEIAERLSEDFRVSGVYANSFQVVEGTIQWNGEYPGPRAAVRLENTAPYAAAVEWGNARDHKPHRVLGRTADMLEANGKL